MQPVMSQFKEMGREDELAAPQLVQTPGGLTSPEYPARWAGRTQLSKECHETCG